VELDVLRDRNPDHVALADGAVRNAYTLKLMNRSGDDRTLTLGVDGIGAREIKIIGLGAVTPPVVLKVDADKIRTVRILVTVAQSDLRAGSQAFFFVLGDPARDEVRTVETAFVSGVTP